MLSIGVAGPVSGLGQWKTLVQEIKGSRWINDSGIHTRTYEVVPVEDINFCRSNIFVVVNVHIV